MEGLSSSFQRDKYMLSPSLSWDQASLTSLSDGSLICRVVTTVNSQLSTQNY